MGYACPVCSTPQRDGEHLAHHLAFTAMLHGDDHESWLDEHVPDWADRDPAGLADAVTPHAADAEYHEVFEDTVDRGRPDVDVGSHAHGGQEHSRGDHGHAHGSHTNPTGPVHESGATDPEVAAALREARELTRQMHEEKGESDGSEEKGEGDESEGDEPSA
ncbi:DUF5810 domain-containing protein [Halorubrum sp. DTA46]|uniref:DUF5810 domain-containing protein n=1 Tax=Halorubrum sp. DTA46 TaxID=3402162 RepID=UPI003AAA6F70